MSSVSSPVADYYSEEEDDYPQKMTRKEKKFKREKNAFLEEEAGEDSGQESEYDGQHYEMTKQEQEKSQKRMLEGRKGIEEKKKLEILDMSEDELNKRYVQTHSEQNESEDFLYDYNTDSKLWSVQVKLGEEKNLCLQILNKYKHKQKQVKEENIKFFSVSFLPQHRNFIYLEADTKKDVLFILNGFENVMIARIAMVKQGEISNIFKMNKKNINVKNNQYVRVKKGGGIYEGDIGQIFDIKENGRCYIRLVPRIDLKKYKNEQKNKGFTEDNDDVKQEKKTKFQIIKEKKRELENALKNRPEARFLSHDGIDRDYRSDYNKHFDGNGYFIKWFALEALDTKTQFSLIELKAFHPEEPNILEFIEANQENLLNSYVSGQFFKNEKVLINQGKYENQKGVIFSVEEDHIKVTLFKQEQPLNFQHQKLTKFFKISQHVKVLRGKHINKTGTIIKIPNTSTVIVLTDNKNEITCLKNDLTACSDKNVMENITINYGGTQETSRLQKFDLVKLTGFNGIAIVISIQSDMIQVLDSENIKKTVSNIQLDQKLDTKKNIAKTRLDEDVMKGSSVRINDGQYKSFQAEVKHVFKDILFLFSQKVHSNGGIFVEKSRNCILISATKQTYKSQQVQQTDKDKKDGTTSNTNISLVGKNIIIKKGKYKNKQGRVLEVIKDNFRILLSAKSDVVLLSKEEVLGIKSNVQHSIGSEFGKTPHHNSQSVYGNQTPWQQGNASPSYYNAINSPYHH